MLPPTSSISRHAAIALSIWISTLLAGCASLSGHPSRSEDVKARMDDLRARYFEHGTKDATDTNVIEKYRAGNLDNGSSKRSVRDDIVYGRMELYDLEYSIFRKTVYTEGTGSNLALDVLGVGVGAAGAAVTGADASRILSAISGGISGTATSLNKNLYYERTLPAILAHMNANREAVRADIYASLQASDENVYPLGRALVDLERFFAAGTIPGAVESIVKEAGVAKNDADDKLAAVISKSNVTDVSLAVEVVKSAAKLPDGVALKVLKNPASPIDEKAKDSAAKRAAAQWPEVNSWNTLLTKLGGENDSAARQILSMVLAGLEDKSDQKLKLWKAALEAVSQGTSSEKPEGEKVEKPVTEEPSHSGGAGNTH